MNDFLKFIFVSSSVESSDDAISLIIGLFIVIIIALLFFMPTIIAFFRNHHYKYVIMGINTILGFTGIGYLFAFVWSVWPRKTAFFDVIANDPTTNSSEDGEKIYSQLGSNINSLRGADNTIKNEKFFYEEEIRRLAALKNEGLISDQEYEKIKKNLFCLD